MRKNADVEKFKEELLPNLLAFLESSEVESLLGKLKIRHYTWGENIYQIEGHKPRLKFLNGEEVYSMFFQFSRFNTPDHPIVSIQLCLELDESREGPVKKLFSTQIELIKEKIKDKYNVPEKYFVMTYYRKKEMITDNVFDGRTHYNTLLR